MSETRFNLQQLREQAEYIATQYDSWSDARVAVMARAVLALVDAVEAAHREMTVMVEAPRGRFPAQDALRDALSRFVFEEPA